MNTPEYYEGESAFLSNDHLRVLLGRANVDETPESLRQNPQKLERLYHQRKLHTSLNVEAVNERLLQWRDKENMQRLEASFDTEGTEECLMSRVEMSPFFSHPDYEPYVGLIEDGGRPAMPFGLFMQIWEDPDANWRSSTVGWRKLLNCPEYLPFYKRGDSLFGWQWRRWQLFRTWQYTNRNMKGDRLPSGMTVDDWTRSLERNLQSKPEERLDNQDPGLPQLEGGSDPALDAIRALQEDREVPQDGLFDSYVRAVRRKLAHHGIVHKPHIRWNPKRQGKLATWLEYVCFEYYCYDTYTQMDMKELQTPYRFLTIWVRNQIPRVEEEAKAAEESKATEEYSDSRPEALATNEITGVAKTLGSHRQDPIVEIQDFAASTPGVPGEEAPEYVPGTEAPISATERSAPLLEKCVKPDTLPTPTEDKPQVPTIVVSDYSHLTTPPGQVNLPVKRQKPGEFLKPPSFFRKRSLSNKDKRPTKKQRPNSDGPLTCPNIPGSMDEVNSKKSTPSPSAQAIKVHVADKVPARAKSPPVKKRCDTLRRSPRIAALQATKRSDGPSASGPQPKTKTRKSKR